MKLKLRKSGRRRKRQKDILTRANELGEQAGNHFSELFISRLRNVREVRLWVVEWALLVLIVLVLAIVQAVWYGDSYNTQAYSKGGNFTEATLGEVKSLNPLYATTSSEKTVARLLFANLASPDASGHMKAELAETIKHDEAGKVWTVRLRDGLRWSDGEAIVADDILLTVELIRDSAAKTTESADFSKIKLEKIDDLTVEFQLPSPYADFIETLEFPLVPAHILKDVGSGLVYEHDFSRQPVGSGPFMLNALQNSATDNSRQTIYLNRNPNYAFGATRLDTFMIKTYDDTDAILRALEAADVSATAELGDGASVSSKLHHRETLVNGGAYAFFNTKAGVTSNVAVRQAIHDSLDMVVLREGLSDMRALDSPILESQAALDVKPQEREKAPADLLADAGYTMQDGKLVNADGQAPRLRLAVQKRGLIEQTANRFAEQLRKMGFEVEVEAFDAAAQSNTSFFASVIQPRDYDILFYELDLGVNADPFVYYSSTQTSKNGWNFSGYSNSLADDALLTARTTADKTLRKTKYEAFLAQWSKDVPAIGLYQLALNYYYVDGVAVYSDNSSLTDALDRFNDVEYWSAQKRIVRTTP